MQLGNMARRHSSYPYRGAGRHSVDWYDQSGEAIVLGVAIASSFGARAALDASSRSVPSTAGRRRTRGIYVLVDDDPREDWHYRFEPPRSVG